MPAVVNLMPVAKPPQRLPSNRRAVRDGPGAVRGKGLLLKGRARGAISGPGLVGQGAIRSHNQARDSG